MNKSKGFTIIELIVVIAIIAVLASLVLVNVTTYIGKSKDTKAKGDMHTLTIDVISSANGGVYTTAATANCVNTNLAYKALSTYDSGIVCQSSTSAPAGSAWCACVKEIAGAGTASETYYCSDSSSGKPKEKVKDVTITSCALECPAASAVCQ